MQYTLFGKYLNQLAIENIISRYEIGVSLGITSCEVSSILTGRYAVSEDLLSKLCTFFDMRVKSGIGDSIRKKWLDTHGSRIAELAREGYCFGRVNLDNEIYHCCYKFCSVDSIDIYTERDGYTNPYFTHYKSLVVNI
jgi:transcriptional regulator with XRE-family HTH domain